MTSVQGATTGSVMGAEVSAAPDTSSLPSRLANVLERATQMVGDRIADLMQQIAGSSSGTEGAQLQQEVDRLQGVLDTFAEKLNELGSQGTMGLISGGANTLGSALSELRGELAESYSNFGTAEVDAGTFADVGGVEQEPVQVRGGLIANLVDRAIGRVMDRIDAMADKFRTDLQAAPGAEATEAAVATDASESTAAATADAAPGTSAEVDAEDPAQMLALYNQDPQAFYESLKELPAEERAMMMHMVQNEMQQVNQMFTMMSQLSQAMHDTQKAIINNLRV